MRWPLRILIALAIVSVPLVVWRLLPVREALTAATALMREGGVLGAAVYFGAYALGSLLTAPIWVFSGLAGYAYGPVRGLLIASPANLVATTTTFLLGRFALSGPLGRRLAQSARWSAIHGAVSGDAFRIGILLRVSPLAPQNLLSYGFSLTPMRLGTFMAVTWLGLFPITVFHVYVGSIVHDIAELIEGKGQPLGAWSWIATVAGLVVTVTAAVLVARLGQRALARRGVVLAGGDPSG